MAVRVALEE